MLVEQAGSPGGQLWVCCAAHVWELPPSLPIVPQPRNKACPQHRNCTGVLKQQRLQCKPGKKGLCVIPKDMVFDVPIPAKTCFFVAQTIVIPVAHTVMPGCHTAQCVETARGYPFPSPTPPWGQTGRPAQPPALQGKAPVAGHPRGGACLLGHATTLRMPGALCVNGDKNNSLNTLMRLNIWFLVLYVES